MTESDWEATQQRKINKNRRDMFKFCVYCGKLKVNHPTGAIECKKKASEDTSTRGSILTTKDISQLRLSKI